MSKNSIGDKQVSKVKTEKKSLSSEQVSEQIRKTAQDLYVKRGCVPGNELADWLEAEKIVRKKLGQV